VPGGPENEYPRIFACVVVAIHVMPTLSRLVFPLCRCPHGRVTNRLLTDDYIGNSTGHGFQNKVVPEVK
jgi:hypothetical protein